MTMPGIYALVSLDGAPLAARDAQLLGLGGDGPPAGAIAFDAVDQPGAVSISHDERGDGRGVAVLSGYLDELEDAARSVGLDASASPALVARAVVEKFGAEASAMLFGEWSLLIWDGLSRQATLVQSMFCRNQLYFAFDGKRLAIAPDARCLRRLDWIDGGMDARGMLLCWATANIRQAMADEAQFRGVKRVAPGFTERFVAGSRSTIQPAEPGPVTRFDGNYDDAIAAIDALLQRMTRQQFDRAGNVACLLSGGLDSTVLAALASRVRTPEEPLALISSVAAAGSGLPDERHESTVVADALRIDLTTVTPPDSYNPYIPSDRWHRSMDLPIAGPWHYLYEALYDAANNQGARLLLDGLGGEYTITGWPTGLPTLTRYQAARRILGSAWKKLRQLPRAESEINAVLAPEAKTLLRTAVPEIAESRPQPEPSLARGDLINRHPALVKSAPLSTSTIHPMLRVNRPFRDRRLVELVAGMPSAFLHRDGLDRAPARTILAVNVPDSIRLRTRGRGFSPDFRDRMARHAGSTLKRIASWRSSDAALWVDLDWLENGLGEIASGNAAHLDDLFKLQFTAHAAAYLAWLETSEA